MSDACEARVAPVKEAVGKLDGEIGRTVNLVNELEKRLEQFMSPLAPETEKSARPRSGAVFAASLFELAHTLAESNDRLRSIISRLEI